VHDQAAETQRFRALQLVRERVDGLPPGRGHGRGQVDEIAAVREGVPDPRAAARGAERAGGGGVENWRNNKNQPFTSDLSGQDFWTLIRAGYAPLGMVMGSCVYHVAHQKFGNKIGNIGKNVEIEQFTQALYDARELAMSRMQAEAEALHAEGIVGVQLRQHSHTWGSHTTEFFAIGTAVRPLRPDHIIERPTMVLTLDA